MCVYFIADPHWGHDNVIRFRKDFTCPIGHDEFIRDNILSVMGKRDDLWILGDFLFSGRGLDMLRDISENVRMIKVVLGNHDTEGEGRRRLLATAIERGYIKQVHGLVKYKEFWLSHAPMHPDELRGKKNIHGHMHDAVIDDPRYQSVCCEQIDYTPIKLEELRKRFE